MNNNVLKCMAFAGFVSISATPTYAATSVVSSIANLVSGLGNAAAGDTIYVKAGTYATTTTISITKSGTSGKPCCLMVNPGEARPVLDFSGMSAASGNRGILLKGGYWHIKGIIIKGAGDNGLNISGNNNIVEFCDFLENRDGGCQLGGGASNNQIINCDSYYNMDPGEGNADGFSPKLDVGSGNYFKGCRSWQNSDDGYDGYLRPADNITSTFESCWCFKNGFRKDGSESLGNGNGFKMGGSDAKDLQHNQILKNCLSVGNRVKGFDQNNNKGSMALYNCTALNNGTNYQIDAGKLAAGRTLTITNCISAGTGGVSVTGGTITTCSWSGGFSVSNADFVSVDPSQLSAARKADGSLPDITFMHLQTNPKSKLIDAGTIISGMDYNGSKPDLGCFETGTSTAIGNAGTSEHAAGMSLLYSGRGKAVFSMYSPCPVALSTVPYTMDGRRVLNAGPRKYAAGSHLIRLFEHR